jgi:hypothetical protein
MSELANAAMGKMGQIPKGRQNGFDLEAKYPCRENDYRRRAFYSDIFAILAPRR